MQSFTDEQHFSHSVARMLENYTSPDFLRRKYAALDRQDIELREHESDERRTRMVFSYSDKPGMDVPGFAKKFVPERAHVVQTVVWDRVEQVGSISIDGDGSPVAVHGEMHLQEMESGGSRNTIRWEVTCSIPLVGGKLEKLILDGLRHKARLDRDVTEQLISESG